MASSQARVLFDPNLFQNRTVNPNPDGWTTASETPTAFDFNRLPAELRVKIVKIHLSQPRIITLNIEPPRVRQRISKKHKRFGVETSAILSDLPPPALLYVSREMQAEAKKILSKLNFDHIINWSQTLGPFERFETYTLPKPIYVNLEQDTLAFRESFRESRIAYGWLFENSGGVKSLGLWLNDHDRYYWNHRKLKNMLAVAPGIETITFIVTEETEECARGSPREIAEKTLLWIREQVQAQNVTLPVRVQLERDYGTQIFYT